MLKTPPLQTATATIDTLCGRLQSATLLEDRRAAILGLRSFAKQYPASVASGSLRELIAILKKDGLGDASSNKSQDEATEGGDVDTIRLVLETLLMLFNPDSNSPEAGDEIALFLADEFSMRQDNITLLLSLLDPTSPYADYYSRLYSVQILSAICAARPDRLQECILSAPLGISRLVGTLDDRRDAVRNAGLLLLVDLTSGANEELRKIVAFEDVFGKTFAMIQMEGGLAEAGITAQDCLSLLANLIRGSASNQAMFRESGCIAQMVQLLQQCFPSDSEAAFTAQARERAAWGLLQVLRLFIVPGESATAQNQVSFFRAGTAQTVIDLGFSGTLPPRIRASGLRVAAALIQSNPPLQEQFASQTVITPADAEYNATEAQKHAQTNGTGPVRQGKKSARGSMENKRTYVIEALLDLALDQVQAEASLREAACALTQAYLTNHDRIKAHFLQRAIAGHGEGETTANVIYTMLHPPEGDAVGVVHASWIIQDLVNDNLEAKNALTAVKEGNEDEGEDVITSIHGFGSQLQAALQTPIDARIVAPYASLLSTLLWDFAPGVDNLLEEGSSLLQTLVGLVKTPGDPVVTGLAAVLLGVVYEFSTKDSPIPRRTLAPLLQQKLGRTKYLDALLQLRRQPAIRDFALDAEEDAAGDGMLSKVFVNLFTEEYTRLRNAVDKDPGVEVLPASAAEAGVDRDVLDDLRQQAQAAKDALSAAQQEALEATQKAEQDRMSIAKELQTASSEIERLRKINQAMQQGHEGEVEKLTKQREQEKNTIQARHQHALNSAKQEAERDAQAKLREHQATSAQKVQELERRIAELGNEHRKEASGHVSVRQQFDGLTGKHNELIRRERNLSKEVEQLHQQRGAAQRKLEQAQEQAKVAESKLEVARKSLDARGEEVEKLKAQVSELRDELQGRDEELKAERAGFADLEKELESAKAAALDAAMGDKTQLDAAENRAEEAETKLNAAEKQVEELRKTQAQQQSRLEELQKKMASAEKKATDAEAKANKAESSLKEAESKLVAAEKKATDAEGKATTAQKELQEAEQKANAAERKAADSAKASGRAKQGLSKEDKDMIAKVDKLEKELEDAKKQQDVAKKALSQKTDSGKDDAEKVKKLEADVKSKNEELSKIKESETKTSSQLEDVRKELAETKKAAEKAKKEVDVAKEMARKATEDSKKASDEAEKAKSEAGKAKADADKAKADSKKAALSKADTEKLAKLQKDLEMAKENEKSAKEELESMLLVMGDIESKRDEYKAKVKKLGGEVTEDEDDDDEEDDDEDEEDDELD